MPWPRGYRLRKYSRSDGWLRDPRRTKHNVNRALFKLIPMFCKTWLNFHWLINFNPPWNNMVVCAAFLILPNGISSTCCLQSYTYSQLTSIYLTDISTQCHSLTSFSTDYNQCDPGSNPRPDLSFLLYKSVIYWYRIFLINKILCYYSFM